MSEPDQTAARQLETTFRPILAAALAGKPIFLQNEELPTDATPGLPCVILTARVTGDFMGLKQGGRYAKLAELRAECRCAANAPDSSRSVEILAEQTRAAIETAPQSALSRWLYLRWERQGDERGFEHGARVITLLYEFRCLSLQ